MPFSGDEHDSAITESVITEAESRDTGSELSSAPTETTELYNTTSVPQTGDPLVDAIVIVVVKIILRLLVVAVAVIVGEVSVALLVIYVDFSY